MNFYNILPKSEIKFVFGKGSIVLWVEKTQNFLDIQQTIKNMFNINKITSIDLFAGNFYVNEFLRTFSFDKLCEKFLTNKFEIILSSDNQMNFKDIKSIPNELKNLNPISLEEKCGKLLIKIQDILETEKSKISSFNDVTKIFTELEGKVKYLDAEVEQNNQDIVSVGVYEEDDEMRELKKLINSEASLLDNFEETLERNFEKIINYKNLERESLMIFKDNRKIIGNIHNHNQLVDDLKDSIKNLELKSIYSYSYNPIIFY